MKKTALIVLVTLVFFGFLITITKSYLADIYYKSSVTLLKNGNTTQARDFVDTAIDLNLYEPKYYYQKAKGLLAEPAQPKEALESMNTAIILNPKNLVTLRNLVPVFYILAVTDSNYTPQAVTYLQAVKHYSPNDAGVYVLVAKYEKALMLNGEFEQSKNIIRNLRPDLLEWHPNLQE